MKNPKALTVDPAAHAKLLKTIRAEIAAGRKLIAQAEAVTPLAKGSVFVDCGFRAWYPAKCALRSLPKGAIVETILSGNSFEVIKSARGEKDLYTCKAYLRRVVDADTPWAKIDLGLGGVTLQKMRLRGIDAPEINTAAGEYLNQRLLDEGLAVRYKK